MGATWVFIDPLTDPLLIFLSQLAITLILTRILGKAFSYLHEPSVIGEIIAGIILGPSALGRIPGFTNAIFPTAAPATPYPYNSVTTFNVIANVGLILFMFLMGMELDRGLLKRNWKLSLPIAISAIMVPFGIGALIAAFWLYDINNEGLTTDPPKTGFILFVGASMSFTAFPVLASILHANNIYASPLGVLVMSAAAVDDVLAWCTLAISTSFSKNGSPVDGLYVVLLALLYVFIMLVPIRLCLQYLHLRLLSVGLHNSPYYFTFLMLLLVGSAYCTEVIGIHAFFGSFVAGIIIPKANNSEFTEHLASRIELLVVEVFMPLYFAASGIRTNIGTLSSGRSWGITVALIVIACAAKFVPACLVTRLVTRRSILFSSTVGILMNTRGLVEIIALNVGLQLQILSTQLFTMLVLMAIATTVLTNPLVWFLYIRRFPSGDDSPSQADQPPIELITVAEVDERADSGSEPARDRGGDTAAPPMMPRFSLNLSNRRLSLASSASVGKSNPLPLPDTPVSR